MRLLHAKTEQPYEFYDEETIPEYAILSHTWGDPRDEVKLQELGDPNVRQKLGYQKIEYCCWQALNDHLEWVWVDTCCIDKSSTAELSEAINSMYRWYERAKVCYVYLADVEHDVVLKRWEDREWAIQQTEGPSAVESPFASSRWFTRGWTLQELLAQENVQFFSKTFQPLGSKHNLRFLVNFITGISIYALDRFSPDRYCAAEKMSWAARRQTTRTEDIAYCLFGLFDIHMPLIYGEGTKAFRRFQEEIMRTTNGQTLFAWGADNLRVWDHQAIDSMSYKMIEKTFAKVGGSEDSDGSLFATSPSKFRKSKYIATVFVYHSGRDYEMPPVMMGAGLRIALPVISASDPEGKLSGLQLAYKAHREKKMVIAILSCFFKSKASFYLGIPLISRGEFYIRVGDLVLIPRDVAEASTSSNKILYFRRLVL